jgi:hypothetical protein
MTPRTLAIIAITAVVSAVAGYFVGNHLVPKKADASISENALKLHVLNTVHQLDTAIFTLERLQIGDLPSARLVLETDIKSSLVILEKLGPNLPLGGKEREMVRETIAKGSAYASAHGLR